MSLLLRFFKCLCLFSLSTSIFGQWVTQVYVSNPFVQPNDSTLNWYGSGDANGDDTLTWGDIMRVQELIDNTFSDPDDRRLFDRADINGDQVVDLQDRIMLEEHLNNEPFFQPSWYWNKLKSKEDRILWLSKMIIIDKSDTVCNMSYRFCDCNQYTDQTLINFHGFNDQSDIQFLQAAYPYNLNDNGRFNLPLLELTSYDYNANGDIFGGHAMNSIIIGNSLLEWSSLCNIEPQWDQLCVQPGEAYLAFMDSAVVLLNGPPILTVSTGENSQVYYQNYVFFFIKEKIPLVSMTYNEWIESWNPGYPVRLDLTTQRDTIKPVIFNNLYPDSVYEVSPLINVQILDDSLLLSWVSFNQGKTKTTFIERIDKDFGLDTGDYHCLIYASDQFYNEVLDSITFTIEDIYPPRISLTSPSNGGEYHYSSTSLDWSVEDPNFKAAWYSLDGGATTTTIGKAGSEMMELEDGAYELLLMAVDTAGNENIDTVSFTVDIWGTSAPEHEVEDSHIKIYPNPTNDILTIETKELTQYNIEISSMNGQLIHSEEVTGPIHQIDLRPFRAGDYLITIRSQDYVMTRKIVKL